MTTAITDEWAVVRHVSNRRVVRNAGPKAEYHRGDNGAVRVYRDEAPARRRADILNGHPATGYGLPATATEEARA